MRFNTNTFLMVLYFKWTSWKILPSQKLAVAYPEISNKIERKRSHLFCCWVCHVVLWLCALRRNPRRYIPYTSWLKTEQRLSAGEAGWALPCGEPNCLHQAHTSLSWVTALLVLLVNLATALPHCSMMMQYRLAEHYYWAPATEAGFCSIMCTTPL